MPAAEPLQLLTDAGMLLATARLAGDTRQELHDALDDAIWFADTSAVPLPPAGRFAISERPGAV